MAKSVDRWVFCGIFVLFANEVNGWVQSQTDKLCVYEHEHERNNNTFACNSTVDKISYFQSVSS